MVASLFMLCEEPMKPSCQTLILLIMLQQDEIKPVLFPPISISGCNDPKFSDRQVWANSADPDQTAPRGAV